MTEHEPATCTTIDCDYCDGWSLGYVRGEAKLGSQNAQPLSLWLPLPGASNQPAGREL